MDERDYECNVKCTVCKKTFTINYNPGPFCWGMKCPKCSAKIREQINQAAAKSNAQAGLPPLVGSQKQVAWAEMVRKQKIRSIILDHCSLKKLDKDRLKAAAENLKSRTAAAWWIDNRDKFSETLLRQEYEITEKPLPPEEKKIADEAKAEAMMEATVRPEKPKTETVAEIRVDGQTVEVNFPEMRGDFRELVKNLRFRWNKEKYIWFRDVTIINGTPHDRAAELGNSLLALGIPIRIFDETLRVHAVYGTFELEQKRWITTCAEGKYEGWYVLSWPYGDDVYRAAKRLRGSRYDKPAILVPAEQYQEILDFAQMYQFAMTDDVQELINKARAIREKALTVKVNRRKEQELPRPGDVPAPLAIPKDVEVPDEFKD